MHMVRYPAVLSIPAMVVSESERPVVSLENSTLGTPTLVGYRPVSSAAREGEHRGLAE
jgi:hypothetical protein